MFDSPTWPLFLYLLVFCVVVLILTVWSLVRLVNRKANYFLPLIISVVGVAFFWFTSDTSSFYSALIWSFVVIMLPFAFTATFIPWGAVLILKSRKNKSLLWWGVAVLLWGLISLAVSWWVGEYMFKPVSSS